VRLEAVNDEEHLPGAVAVGWRFFLFQVRFWGAGGVERELLRRVFSFRVVLCSISEREREKSF
jgi:hypothetical protein